MTALLIALSAGCATAADAGGGTGVDAGPTGGSPYQNDDLVIRVSYSGGFVPAVTIPTRLPLLSVYGDGRVITEGPQIEIFPPPALPNLQLQKIAPGDVGKLVDLAIKAGIGDKVDYGQPNVTDMPTTRFVVLTKDGVKTTDVYALSIEDGYVGGLTPEQKAARHTIQNLLSSLNDLEQTLGAGRVTAAAPYTAETIAAVAGPYVNTDPNQPQQTEKAWPGPALPGPSMGAGLDLDCVSASGDEAAQILAAAKSANTLTPWRSGAKLYSVTFRPLLPDEHSCADLRRQS
jgi:hypothetical protein